MRVLVIKHGALGDIILAASAFAAIRAAHAADEIFLLTSTAFAPFLAPSPWFDNVITDPRPAFWNLPGLLFLRSTLRGFGMVYDLQTSARSSRYFALAGKPRWSGIANGCAYPHTDPNRNDIHTRERLAGQLTAAGISRLPAADFSWVQADLSRFALPASYTVLVPGAALHRPEKRWPVEHFAELATRLPGPLVVAGSNAEAPLGAIIQSTAPRALNLTGKTSLNELVAIMAGAKLAIGNDTGPMHIAAASNVPSVVLFSAASTPALTAPRYTDGNWPVILQAPVLSGVSVAQVLAALP